MRVFSDTKASVYSAAWIIGFLVKGDRIAEGPVRVLFFLFLLWVGGWVWFLSGGFEDEVGVVGVWYNSIDGAGSSAKVGCMIYTPGIESGVNFPSVIVLLVFGFSS